MINLMITEKFEMDGFKKSEPKTYMNVTKCIRNGAYILIYVNDECVESVDEFYHNFQIIK